MNFKTLVSFLLMLMLLGFIFPLHQAGAGKIKWYSFKEGVTAGKSQNKKMYIHFMTNWCHWCKVMDQKTFSSPEVIAYLNENFISIKVNTSMEKRLKRMFRVNGVPDNWFLSGEGEGLDNLPGYIPPEQFMVVLKLIIRFGQIPRKN